MNTEQNPSITNLTDALNRALNDVGEMDAETVIEAVRDQLNDWSENQEEGNIGAFWLVASVLPALDDVLDNRRKALKRMAGKGAK